MKTHKQHRHWLLLFALVFHVFGLSAGWDTSELNRVDTQGMRQGYWIIKGYMTTEQGYGASTTVEEGHYVNNSKEGVWKRYYPSGVVRSEITYRNNAPYGPYKVYYTNGQLEEKSTWHRNKNVGEFLRFHENGQPQQVFYFADNGKRNGEQRYFHENGQASLVVTVVNGKEDGEMRRYDENGRLKETKTLSAGQLEPGSIRTYKGASKPTSTTPKPSKEAVAARAPEPTEQPNEAYLFEPNGHNILYNKGQQLTQVGDFKNGRLWDGKWYRYNGNGILIRIEIYQNGRYIGTGVIEENNN
jgi:antitoxin component YwqK of YwqJK toxin-antitoxin module